jgi:hypothetical protein
MQVQLSPEQHFPGLKQAIMKLWDEKFILMVNRM